MPNRYEGDTATCQRCGHVHYLKDKLIFFCKNCGFNMSINIMDSEGLIKHLDQTYKKMRVDDIK